MKPLQPQLAYNKRLQRSRKTIIQKLGGKCNSCGDTQKLQIHHKWRHKHNNLINNLSLLCTDCHKKRHRSKVRSGEYLRRMDKFFSTAPIEEQERVRQRVRRELDEKSLERQTQKKLKVFIL